MIEETVLALLLMFMMMQAWSYRVRSKLMEERGDFWYAMYRRTDEHATKLALRASVAIRDEKEKESR